MHPAAAILQNVSGEAMTDIESRARCYAQQLIRFAQSAPMSKECFLNTLQNAAYLILVIDSMRILIHIATDAKLEIADSRGALISPGNAESPCIVPIRASIEKVLFPGIRTGDRPAGITICTRWTVMDGLAFSSPAFNKRYWSGEKFYRQCAEDLPLRVVETGDLLGVNLLYGWEAQQEPRSRLLEIIRVFGSSDMLPSDDEAIEDLAWNDFSHGLPGRGAKEPAWSFAAFLRELEAPAKETVLLLGSYHSEEVLGEAERALKELGYSPFTLRDAPDLPFQTNTEKFLAGVMCSAFVVVVDTHPSGHLSELTHLLDLRLRPVLILRHDSSPASWFQEDRVMTDDLFRVVVESSFNARCLAEHARWAQSTVINRVKKLNAVNYWRKPSA